MRWQEQRGGIVRLHFSDEERDRAIRVGNARQDFHDQRGTRDSYGLNVDHAEAARINRVGALAELCVALFVGAADRWVEVTENYHDLKGDVIAGLEVRSTRARNGGLILHPRDADDRTFVAVRTHGANEGWVELVGWMLAADGKQQQWWPGKYPQRPCFMVPSDALQPMLTLPWYVGSLHPDAHRCDACGGFSAGDGDAWRAWCGCPF